MNADKREKDKRCVRPLNDVDSAFPRGERVNRTGRTDIILSVAFSCKGRPPLVQYPAHGRERGLPPLPPRRTGQDMIDQMSSGDSQPIQQGLDWQLRGVGNFRV
jgi:hypothetical protein